MNKIIAIVVTYEPDLQVLQTLVLRLQSQVDDVVVVDNSSHCLTNKVRFFELFEKVGVRIEFIQLNLNYGIAKAQNIGISYARSKKATHVLLMDQDSIPKNNMVFELSKALLSLPSPAAVGPVYTSEHQNQLSVFSQLKGLRRVKQVCNESHPIVRTDALIASGCLIPLSVIDVVGDMCEELFIDYVDTEWGLRARAAGYLSYAVWGAKMSHQLGNYAVRFMGREMVVHSPLRRYYQYRNAILLYKMKHIPLNWKINDAGRLFIRAWFYALTNQPRVLNVKMMFKGFWHGLIGRTGKMP